MTSKPHMATHASCSSASLTTSLQKTAACTIDTMPELLDLCYDVMIKILEEINPEDVAACAQASKGFNDFITGNTRLHKTLYLKHFVRTH